MSDLGPELVMTGLGILSNGSHFYKEKGYKDVMIH